MNKNYWNQVSDIMRRNSYFIFICIFFCIPLKLLAVEIETHARITQEIIPKTVLVDGNFLQSLGLDEFKNDFGLTYFDYVDSIKGEILTRTGNDIENNIITDENFNEEPYTLIGWFMRGAIREDDCGPALIVCKWVWDDPVNSIRPVRHFFDPYTNTGADSNEKAPNWALGTKDAFSTPLTPISDDDINHVKYNHFTIFDAQEAMYRALSGQYIDNSNAVVKLDASKRKAYWATTFRALGNVIHLVQDMGQPQHTRNDFHTKFNTLEQQVYEAFTNSRILGENFNCLNGEQLSTKEIKAITFKTEKGNDYPIPSFSKYSDFFSTQPGNDTQNGLGLADYSNREFYTAGTNVGESIYPLPDVNNLTETNIKFTDSCMTEFTADFQIYTGDVVDQLNPSENSTVALTSRSQWDLKNEQQTYFPDFALNQTNYTQMADNLLPRSVAYSAGFINHFFRGRLDVTKSEQITDTSGNTLVAVTIKNTSAQNSHMSNGKLEIFYDAIVDGEEIRKPVQLAEGETGYITELPNGDETTLKIILPGDLDTNKENPFVIVYNGIIGEEPGVAGKVFSLSEETAILLFYEKDGSTDLLVKRSVDEGKSWENVDATNFAGFRLYPNSRGYQLLPSGKGRGLLVGTNSSGIFTLRTTDNGNSWAPHLEQAYGQYTEVLNVIKAIHAGDGRLITYNNIYSGSYKVGTRTYYTYDVELSESFDDGETWTPLSLPFDVNGRASQLYYLGNQHLYLSTSGYDTTCNCVTTTWYESFDGGENFSKAAFSPADLEWQPSWYRDAYAFDNGQIITMKNTGTLDLLTYNFAVSHDGGKTLNITDKASKHEMWPQAEPIHIRPIGQGKFVSYVFDPWTAYEKGYDTYYEGSLVSKDRGQNWEEMYQGTLSTWNGPWYLMMGVLTNDDNNLKYIH